MSKVTMEFQIPEEEEEYRRASYGGTYFSALWELDQHCRSVIKHGHEYESVEDLAQAIRDMMPDLDM